MNTETNCPLKWVPSASSHEAALHAWTVIMAAAAVLLVILGIYHRFSLPAGLRRDDSVRKSAVEELKDVIGDFFTTNCFLHHYQKRKDIQYLGAEYLFLFSM